MGNCQGTTGTDVCTNGLFCVKKTVTYSVAVKAITFKWDTYTKGCASVREHNGAVTTNTCYDIGTTDKGTYKTSSRDCYCQTDFCNSSTSIVFSVVTILFTMVYF
ncbi:unnamed protein product [Heligmosomoides polygyrus]|uniref:Activin_recp domain-containing protein n=1 Tax=Heligmosomoides polygyrus TaxID=6339 RepID=A0A183G2L5_HELPZ|nr:unnamed protein product [Heligmosomoides polygyrus]